MHSAHPVSPGKRGRPQAHVLGSAIPTPTALQFGMPRSFTIISILPMVNNCLLYLIITGLVFILSRIDKTSALRFSRCACKTREGFSDSTAVSSTGQLNTVATVDLALPLPCAATPQQYCGLLHRRTAMLYFSSAAFVYAITSVRDTKPLQNLAAQYQRRVTPGLTQARPRPAIPLPS
jgi:hypothetical protein